jgi:hypothetical protein
MGHSQDKYGYVSCMCIVYTYLFDWLGYLPLDALPSLNLE